MAGDKMTGLPKTMFLESVNAITTFQERMVDLYLSMIPILPDENKQFIKNLPGIYKRGLEHLQVQITRDYENACELFPLGRKEAIDSRMVLQDIEEKVLGKLDFGFSPEVLNVLNNPNAGKKEIEALKAKISPEILAKIMNIADSAYFGTLKKGKVNTFYDAVILLGMKHTELLILYFALFILVKDKDAELVLAKSFARYALGGYIYAKEFGLSEEATYKVELGCLFVDIGKIIIYLYRTKYEEDYHRFAIDESFIENNHAYLGLKICDKFNITEELKRMIFAHYFSMDAKHISLSGILKTVYYLVESMFCEHKGKLLIASPMPDQKERLTHSLGVVIRELFAAVGLSGYLEIVDTSSAILSETAADD